MISTVHSGHVDPGAAADPSRPQDIVADPAIVDQAVKSMLVQLGQQQLVLEPFRHVVAYGLFDPTLLRRVVKGFPPPESPLWFRYDSPLEKKLSCNKVDLLPPFLGAFVTRLNSPDVAAAVGNLFGIDGLVVDPCLHGGGLHMTEPGGKLDIHLDFADHPKLPLTRRVNLILYLNEDWQDPWGGELELWDAEMRRCVVRITPGFNRLVLFEVHDRAYHGHPDALTCPADHFRRSIALYFLTDRQTANAERPRAQFVARPRDGPDPALDELRRQREQLDFGY